MAAVLGFAMVTLTVGCGGPADDHTPGAIGPGTGNEGQVEPNSVQDDNNGSEAQADAGPPVCRIPDYGCACADADEPVACQIIIHRDHNIVDCYHGHRKCVEGRWSRCSQAAGDH